MTKPKTLEEQRKQIADLIAMSKKDGTYGEVPIFRDNYDTIISTTIPRNLPPEGEAKSEESEEPQDESNQDG